MYCTYCTYGWTYIQYLQRCIPDPLEAHARLEIRYKPTNHQTPTSPSIRQPFTHTHLLLLLGPLPHVALPLRRPGARGVAQNTSPAITAGRARLEPSGRMACLVPSPGAHMDPGMRPCPLLTAPPLYVSVPSHPSPSVLATNPQHSERLP